ncbi:MAG: 3TM-type holin [Acidobacteriaceae bacterium]
MTSLVSIGNVIKPLSDLVEHFFPNAEDKARAQAMLQKIADSAGNAQIAVDVAEAKSGNWFVGGWRSYIGWICGTALGYAMIARPILLPWVPALAPVDLTPAISILSIMLGVGGAHAMLRTSKGL